MYASGNGEVGRSSFLNSERIFLIGHFTVFGPSFSTGFCHVVYGAALGLYLILIKYFLFAQGSSYYLLNLTNILDVGELGRIGGNSLK